MAPRSVAALLALSLFLGTYQGYVALLESGKAQPHQVFPYRVSSLPPEDQEALRFGIPLSSGGELNRLLEDFLS